jgi:hypothetical protein
MLKIAFWAQKQSSYQRAEEALAEVMHINVNDDTVRLVANFVGGIVFENDCIKAEEAFDLLESAKMSFLNNKEGALYIQTVGAALNTRIKGDDGSTWRENKLCEVFSTNNIRFWKDKQGAGQRQILKKEYVGYIGAASEFKKHVFASALRNGYGAFRETVVISDGAEWIRNMVLELFPDAQHILDYFRLCENVNIYAKHLFNMDETKYRPWADDICEALKKSRYGQVLKELEPFRAKNLQRSPVNLHEYISNNIRNIDYAAYEQRGYFIGSGGIEGANKMILQDRLKRAGMSWNTKSAQAMLTLKAKNESGLWLSDVVRPFMDYCYKLSRSL